VARKRRNRGTAGQAVLNRQRGDSANRTGPAARWWWLPVAIAVIVLATAAAYWNSFGGVFVYDDTQAILENPTIRQLWPLSKAFSPPANGETVTGRPLLNLSFALNFARGGTSVWGYHLVNLSIHILNALLLFGIVRLTLMGFGDWGLGKGGRNGEGTGGASGTLQLSALSPQASPCHLVTMSPCHPIWLALAVALLWALHPLQTESVTYIVQRAESLGACFYLLTMYCVIRGAQSDFACPAPPAPRPPSPAPRPVLWYAAAVLACLAGMATKEVLLTAPLVMLLYDRTFLAGSFRGALRRRWGLYLALAATWALLVYLVYTSSLLSRTGQFEDVPDRLSYARTEPGVILYYLRLCLWPYPQCLEYSWPLASSWAEVVLPLLGVTLLAAVTLWALVRRPALGFLGAWLFLIFGPSSSFVPLAQAAFEHRLYLPLAAVVVLVVIGGYQALQLLVRRGIAQRVALALGCGLLVLVCLVLGGLTCRRNADYRSALAVWQDVVDKAPHSYRAQTHLATALREAGRFDEAVEHLLAARKAIPDEKMKLGVAIIECNLGLTLTMRGQPAEAIPHLQQVLSSPPPLAAEGHYHLGNALAKLGRRDEALAEYRLVLAIKPAHLLARVQVAGLLLEKRLFDEAVAQYRAALAVDPHRAEIYNNLANALVSSGHRDDAIVEYRKAIAANSNNPEAHRNLGIVLFDMRRWEEAIAEWTAALRLRPDDFLLLDSLSQVYAQTGRPAEARTTAEKALALAEAQGNAKAAEIIRARLRQSGAIGR
jgi:protein O-mannosyl-transferase